jgi:predicted Zn-dependent peptidase
VAQLADMLLAYKGAGLIDIDLNQKQKVLEASSSIWALQDYSTHFLAGVPREGQTLEQVRDLLLGELNKLKRGEFDEATLQAIIRNVRADRTRSFESNAGRAFTMLDAYTLGLGWSAYNNQLHQMEQITKKELVSFVNSHYGNDYVVVYKRQGIDSSVAKVEKPPITPVELNRDAESEFLHTVLATPSPEVQPSFIDYNRDITTLALKPDLPVRYVHNGENDLFSLYYVFDMGENNDRKLPLAL